ncbi:hypothetical protein MCOR27_009585 [Pyricularia oryzae]|uniref:Uncharacterized protein n=2 Tax=Pyricularia TaxID=48558 RepID=A0ABQ8NA70_PYRGI|nr:hypothetical protein MCOR19_001017 [Pyricularia oryzae]KAI6292461.1 hypothetical protein MCOR33_009831 [Pyricularia grisea]KAI6269759.1 hypothetical protein MCOR27_009585 [Pyricularia oryzae]KAI6320793.1 hypothetical protein MCOR29_005160 [Pyricularia oryzae]KAI6371954.1 hypothetical protein MCOR31_003891 [Pyricularia oryzae]
MHSTSPLLMLFDWCSRTRRQNMAASPFVWAVIQPWSQSRAWLRVPCFVFGASPSCNFVLNAGEGGLQNSNHLNRVDFRRSNAPERSFKQSSDQSLPLSAVVNCQQQPYEDEYQQDQGRHNSTDAAYTVRQPTLGLNRSPGQHHEYNARSPASWTSQCLSSLCSDIDPDMTQGGWGM